MPSYKQVQYGLDQYGIYSNDSEIHGSSKKWKFIKSRITIIKNGNKITIQQHTPIKMSGYSEKIRIQTNKGNCLYLNSIFKKGEFSKIRISTNKNEHALESMQLKH